MTAPTWQCAACATYNADGGTACEICGTAKTVVKAAPPRAKSASVKAKSAPGGATSGTGAAKSGSAGRKKPAAKKPAAERPASSSPFDPSIFTSTERDELRATRELAALMPELFLPDGTLKPRTERPAYPRAWGRIGPTVADGGVLDIPEEVRTARASAARAAARPRPAAGRGGSAAARRAALAADRPEPTVGQQVAGCGCLFVLVAVVVTAIVMLVMNWSDIFS